MTSKKLFPRFFGIAALWFVALFVIDTAFTLWVWKEPYLLEQTVVKNLLLALVFALLDHFFAPFARRKHNPK